MKKSKLTELLEALYVKHSDKNKNSLALYSEEIAQIVKEEIARVSKILKLKEDEQLDQAFNDAKPVEDENIEEEAKRDYKKEYAKYGKSEKSKKYRAELNKYNRDKGTYGNGDGKDASHKGGKIVGFESESKNRGRAEKSRLKKK
jgi:hypothetical protein